MNLHLHLDLNPTLWTKIDSSSDFCVWRDVESPQFRLKCMDSHPWGKDWKLVPISDSKTINKIRYVRKVTFCLFPPETVSDRVPVELERTVEVGNLFDSQGAFRCWSLSLPGGRLGRQVIYSLWPQPFDPSDKLLRLMWEAQQKFIS